MTCHDGVMCTPKTRQEYEARFMGAYAIEGKGIDGLRVRVPCPACAAPDFLTYGALDVETAWTAGAVCIECGRGFRAIFDHSVPMVTSWEIVQTRGDDVPPWCAARRRA